MNRRESIKSLLVGSAATTAFITPGCKETPKEPEVRSFGAYGRTPKELEHDAKILEGEPLFSPFEIATIATLCDIILPPTTNKGGANDAEVPEFVEFIAKDLPDHQLPLQGGIMWLNGESYKRFEKPFIEISNDQQLAIVDDIAYPDPLNKESQLEPGRLFFTRMRNLVLTGYYTSKLGIEDLGYQGNRPNTWDGVPADVLSKHGFTGVEEWHAKCVDQSKKHITAEWDDQGNLLT